MPEVLVAETCPVCKGRKYVKKGEKLLCCPEEPKKAPAKPKAKQSRSTIEPTEET